METTKLVNAYVNEINKYINAFIVASGRDPYVLDTNHGFNFVSKYANYLRIEFNIILAVSEYDNWYFHRFTERQKWMVREFVDAYTNR